MFYVSDIHGVLTPYDPGIAEVERIRAHQLRAQGLESARLAAEEASQAAATNPSAQHTTSIDPKAPAVGTAGATALFRGHGAKESAGTTEASQTSGAAPKRPRPPVGQVQQIHQIRKQEGPGQFDVEPVGNPYSKIDEPSQQRKKAVSASEIMSSPVHRFTKGMTVEQAGALFKEHRFRHVPVVSETGKLIGIFSDRDYLKAPSPTDAVADLMATEVISARPETEIRHIADLMFRNRIGAMPIVDDQEELVGIITRSDILRALVNKAPLDIWI